MKSEKHPRAKSRGTGDPSPNSSHHFQLAADLYIHTYPYSSTLLPEGHMGA